MVASGSEVEAVIGALVLKRRAANRLLCLLAGGLIVSGVPLLIVGLGALRTGGGDQFAAWCGGLILVGFVCLTWDLYNTHKLMRELAGNIGTRTPMVWRQWCSLRAGSRLIPGSQGATSPTYAIELWAGLWPGSEDTLNDCPPTLYFQQRGPQSDPQNLYSDRDRDRAEIQFKQMCISLGVVAELTGRRRSWADRIVSGLAGVPSVKGWPRVSSMSVAQPIQVNGRPAPGQLIVICTPAGEILVPDLFFKDIHTEIRVQAVTKKLRIWKWQEFHEWTPF
jgi:hypothetical protein